MNDDGSAILRDAELIIAVEGALIALQDSVRDAVTPLITDTFTRINAQIGDLDNRVTQLERNHP